MSSYAKWRYSKIVDKNPVSQPQASQVDNQQTGTSIVNSQPQTAPVLNQGQANSVGNQQIPSVSSGSQSKAQKMSGNVAPEPQQNGEQQGGREKEIAGGLRNAIERGTDVQKAKQSFLNSGYTEDEVEKAVQLVPNVSSKIAKPLKDDSASNSKGSKKKEKSAESSGKSASKGLVTALIIMVILLLLGAGATFFFWDKLF